MTSNTDIIEIRNGRSYPVSRKQLYGAFADPDRLAQWWGPHGFTNTIPVFDLRPGGMWFVTMTASNGTDFENRWTFEDVVEGEMIRAKHHEPVHVFMLEMRFGDEPGGSRLDWLMVFERTEENEAIEKFLHAANEQNLERLEALLASRRGGQK